MSIRSYRELHGWQRGMDLIVLAYRVCAQLPPAENFGLKGQIRRSAVSIPSNIAEGHCSGSTANFLRHIHLAQGSLGELETQFDAVARLEYVDAVQLIEPVVCAEEVGRMLTRLAAAL